MTSTMEMVAFLGTQLHEITDLKLLVSKGLIRFSVRDFFDTVPPNVKFNQWIEIIKVHLRNRISKLVENPEEVCDSLVERLIDNQSVITMVNV